MSSNIQWYPNPTTTSPEPPPPPPMSFNDMNIFELLELRKRVDELEKKLISLQSYCEWLKDSMRNEN